MCEHSAYNLLNHIWSKIMETLTFIDSTITAMSEKSNKFALIARTIQSQDHASAANRIALAYIQLDTDRRAAKRANLEPAVKPEQMFSFLQALMNQCCWAARRVLFAQNVADSALQASGIDFSEAIADDAGVSGTKSEDINTLIEEDFFVLNNVQSWLAGRMNYLTEIDDLAVFADREVNDNNEWVLKHSALSFDEALPIMDMMLDDMREQEAVVVHDQAASTDFGDSSAVVTRIPVTPSLGLVSAPKPQPKGFLKRLFA